MPPERLVERLAQASGLRLRRAWPRGGDRLLLEYAGAGGELAGGQWLADEAELARVATATRAAATAPGDAEVLEAGGERVLLQRRGADRRLTALAGLLTRQGARLLVHRPERRAVVELPGSGFAKVVPPGRLPSTDAPSTPRGSPLRLAVAVDHRPADGVLVTAPLPGRSLHDLLGGDEAGALAGAERAGAAIRALHGSDPRHLPGAGLHDGAAEAAVLVGWLDRLAPFEPGLHARAVDAAAGLADRLARLGAPAVPAVLHRDLHDKQILLGPDGSVGLLDLDTMTAGDPALDLANLLVHLDLRALQGRVGPERAGRIAEAVLSGYDPPGPVLAALPVYAEATRLRLACVYAFRPGWPGVPDRLLEGAG